MEKQMTGTWKRLVIPILYVAATYGLYLEFCLIRYAMLLPDEISGGWLRAAKLFFLAGCGLRLILWFACVIHSFLMRAKGDTDGLVQAMLLLKYGLIPFFIINFIILTAFGTILGILSMGFALFWYVPVFCTMTWLAILPGAFYGFQVCGRARREGKISGFQSFFCGLFLFCFLTDVLCAMYLSVKKYQIGKKAAVLVGAMYLIGIAMVLWLYFK